MRGKKAKVERKAGRRAMGARGMRTPWQTAAAEKKITATKALVCEITSPHVGTSAADRAQAKRERRQARNRANA